MLVTDFSGGVHTSAIIESMVHTIRIQMLLMCYGAIFTHNFFFASVQLFYIPSCLQITVSNWKCRAQVFVFSTVRKGKMCFFTSPELLYYSSLLFLSLSLMQSRNTYSSINLHMYDQQDTFKIYKEVKKTEKSSWSKKPTKNQQKNQQTNPQHYHIITSNAKVKNTHHSKTKWTISIKVRVSTKEAECVCVCVCMCERERKCVCVCVCERESVCVCVCYKMTWFQHQRSSTVGWTVLHFWPVFQANREEQQLTNCLQRQNQPWKKIYNKKKASAIFTLCQWLLKDSKVAETVPAGWHNLSCGFKNVSIRRKIAHDMHCIECSTKIYSIYKSCLKKN